MPLNRALKNVLIVEDDPVFADVVGRAIARISDQWSTYRHQSGGEALAFLKSFSWPLDLVLVDLGLPDMDGVEVIRAVRDKHPDAAILVLSVITMEKTVLDAIRSGARGYLSKDEPEEAIAQGIRQVLNGNYPISPSLAHYLFKLAGQTDKPADVASLSARELELLRHIARGQSYEEAASQMNVKLTTIQFHIRNLYRKLDAHSQVQAVHTARQLGLIE